MKAFDEAAKSHKLTSLEVAIRWIAYHSALRDEDGIIVGASKAEQIQETFNMMKKGALPREVLKATERIWVAVKESRGEII